MTSVDNSQLGQEEQLSLFGTEIEEISEQLGNSRSAFSDPAFANNKLLPVHRWVPWIAGFSSTFVKAALDGYLDGEGVVLDPFAGVGTTLVEATLSGFDAIGFEINPYAALACHIKVNAYLYDADRLQCEISKLKLFSHEKTPSNYSPKNTAPVGFKTRADFYSPLVLHKVLVIQDFIDTIEDGSLRQLFKLVFAATMVSYSNYSYEPSLGRRVSSGKAEIQDFPVVEAVLSKLIEVKEDIVWCQAHRSNRQVRPSVINDSFFYYQKHLLPQSVDLIVTSPPYLNNYHYIRNTRPQLYWLGYVERPQDFKSLENSNFGKYWQTVRDEDYIGLDFLLPDSDLEERLNQLRSLNHEKKVYGGGGWANYAASYFNDCYKLAQGIQYSLKPGGTALVVIGNSILQGLTIPTDQYLGKIAQVVGLELVKIDVPRAARVGSSIIQSSVRAGKAQDSHQLYEAVVELKKR